MRLRRLEPVVRRALQGPCACPPGTRVLVAVSGGADSTALLLVLARLRAELGLDLAAAHLHHGLRGAEADGDLEFLRALCARLRVPLLAARWNTPLRMRRRRLSGEAGLRTLRREFLAGAAKRFGAHAIATAHTADDQLETVLMRLMRGAGVRGLSGMHPRHGAWIKPLLAATRLDVVSDLRAHQQAWREDSTNQGLAPLRNRVRHQVIPALLGAAGGASDTARHRLALRVSRSARAAREADRVVDRLAARAIAKHARDSAENALDSKVARSYPAAIRRRWIERVWRRVSPRGTELMHRHLDALLALVASDHGGQVVHLPGGLEARREGRHVRFLPSRCPDIETRPLPVPGRIQSPEGRLSTGWVTGRAAHSALAGKPSTVEYFAADELQGGLEVREGGADERFVPLGRRRAIRLRDFLAKQRVSGRSRKHPTVLADAEGILWVVGVRRAARALVTEATPRALRVLTERHD